MEDIFKRRCEKCGMPLIKPLEKRLKLCEECIDKGKERKLITK